MYLHDRHRLISFFFCQQFQYYFQNGFLTLLGVLRVKIFFRELAVSSRGRLINIFITACKGMLLQGHLLKRGNYHQHANICKIANICKMQKFVKCKNLRKKKKKFVKMLKMQKFLVLPNNGKMETFRVKWLVRNLKPNLASIFLVSFWRIQSPTWLNA